MKRTSLWIGIVVACMVATGTPEALGQPVQFGGFVELGWSELRGERDALLQRVDARSEEDVFVGGPPSGSVGLTAVVPLNDWLAAEPQLALETRGVTFRREVTGMGILFPTDTYTGTYDAVYTTLTAPVSVRLPVSDRWAVRALAGPWVSVRVASDWRRGGLTEAGFAFPEQKPFETRRFDAGGTAGLGLSYESTFIAVTGRFVFDVVVDAGAFDVGDDRLDLRSRSARLSLGYVIESWGIE